MTIFQSLISKTISQSIFTWTYPSKTIIELIQLTSTYQSTFSVYISYDSHFVLEEEAYESHFVNFILV